MVLAIRSANSVSFHARSIARPNKAQCGLGLWEVRVQIDLNGVKCFMEPLSSSFLNVSTSAYVCVRVCPVVNAMRKCTSIFLLTAGIRIRSLHQQPPWTTVTTTATTTAGSAADFDFVVCRHSKSCADLRSSPLCVRT